MAPPEGLDFDSDDMEDEGFCLNFFFLFFCLNNVTLVDAPRPGPVFDADTSTVVEMDDESHEDLLMLLSDKPVPDGWSAPRKLLNSIMFIIIFFIFFLQILFVV